MRHQSARPFVHDGPTSEREADLLVGGRYRLLGAIGSSPWGQALRAERLSNGQQVCIHVVPTPVHKDTLDPEFPLAVARCAQLSHRNVVTLRGYGRSKALGDGYYVVSDPLLGVSLSDYLDAHGTLPLRQALSFAQQIARGLRAAHSLGLYHGTLTPDAVRVLESNGQALLQVVGLGTLPSLVAAAEPSSHVRSLAARFYAAPELTTDNPVNDRADLYALGAIMLRMLAGPDALSQASPSVGREAVSDTTPRSEQDRFMPTLHAEVDALLSQAMAVDPEKRFLDVAAMEHAIRRCEDRLRPAFDVVSPQSKASQPGSGASGKGSSRWTDTVRALLANKADMARLRYNTCVLVLVLGIALAWSMGGVDLGIARE